MKKTTSICLWLIGLLFVSQMGYGQVTNYALKFGDSNATLNSGVVKSLDNLSNFTIQFWMHPTQWNTGATILKRGEGAAALSIKLGGSRELILQVGTQTLPFKSTHLAPNQWTQVSLMVSNGNIKAYVNNSLVKSSTLAGLKIPTSSADLILGEAFVGRLDEVRIWKTTLKDANYFLWRNTINKYHPNWDDLLIYYKFDQNLCTDNIVDYKFNHHGTFVGNTQREAVKDNAKFVYRINSAYTDLGRWSDRKVDREKYLMANDIIMLGVDTYRDGTVSIPLPINNGVVTNGNYLSEFEGRKGVLALNGNGAKMVVGKKALDHKTEAYTFHTWVYLDEWVENAYLFKKEASNTRGFSIRFGKADTREIIARINGKEYIRTIPKKDKILKTWYFIGIYSNTAAVSPDDYFQFVFGERSNRGARIYPTTKPATLLPQGVDNTDAIVGLNMKGKLDETIIWRSAIGYSSLMNYKNWIPFPSHTVALDPGGVLYNMNSAWKYDDPNDVGYDYYSYYNIMKSVRDNFANHRGYTVRLSVKGHDGWQNTFANATTRKKLAKGIAKFGAEFDGIDLDFEWCNNNRNCWENYGQLVSEIAAELPSDKVFSVSPHAFDYGFPVNKMHLVDFFTFQNYGPQKMWFEWGNFENSYNNFIRHGYPAQKILMSYSAITSSPYDGNTAVGQPVGVGYFQDPAYRPHMDSYVDGDGRTRYVTGVNQTRRRAELMQEKGTAGIFYWDMGNDIPTSHKHSLARTSNFAISSNVDSIVTTVKTTGIKNVFQQKKATIMVYPNPATDFIKLILPNDATAEAYDLTIYNSAGQQLKTMVVSNQQSVPVKELQAGIYIVAVAIDGVEQYRQTFIKKD